MKDSTLRPFSFMAISNMSNGRLKYENKWKRDKNQVRILWLIFFPFLKYFIYTEVEIFNYEKCKSGCSQREMLIVF